MLGVTGLRRILAMALVVGASSGALAEDGAWSVGKSSGEVWVTTSGAEQASLNQEEILRPGDTIRTGHNGRVLLVRGEETILVAPNSVIGLPEQKKDGLSTTILQQAGSILLDVEKRNVKHFEVETPYLAAVVKGTRFSVTVGAASTSVAVRRGLVEVSDFKSGDVAQVMPGQAATLFAHGKPGLTLSGSGAFNPIEHGLPRAPSIERIPVPKGGLAAPRNAGNGMVIHALGRTGSDFGKSTIGPLQQRSADFVPVKRNVTRISTALGEVKLNVAKATHGLARGSVTPGTARNASAKGTVWSDAKASLNGVTSASQGNSSGDSSANANAAAGNSAAASAASAAPISPITTAASDSKNGNGNGATGSGNGNGNSGNGNGNGGVGNGKGNGNAKH
jgi:hypothetical protein